MSFGLKNVRATYQCLVNKVFAALIGKIMEVHVDDMITKSVKELNHVKDLKETFKVLRKYETKLNSKKCTFRVSTRKFLGYMIDKKALKPTLTRSKWY